MNSLKDLEMARVLLVDDDPASRLTLQTVLEAGGYAVHSAASAAEAYGKMEEFQYELILTDMQMESPESGLRVLQHARMMEYKPATAVFTASQDSVGHDGGGCSVLVEPEDVPGILDQVAGLIGVRASRKVERELRMAHATG
jgi:CheY-like chemotaxis protein